MNPIQLVEARLDGGRNWWQGNARNPLNADQVCLVTAGAAFDGVVELMDRVACEQFPDRMQADVRATVAFNDHPDTVFAEIRDLFLPKVGNLWDEGRD